jgi:hypothetical protein
VLKEEVMRGVLDEGERAVEMVREGEQDARARGALRWSAEECRPRWVSGPVERLSRPAAPPLAEELLGSRLPQKQSMSTPSWLPMFESRECAASCGAGFFVDASEDQKSLAGVADTGDVPFREAPRSLALWVHRRVMRESIPPTDWEVRATRPRSSGSRRASELVRALVVLRAVHRLDSFACGLMHATRSM